MSSIVLELQREALNNEVSVTELLRKAIVIARKLRVSDMQSWLHHELEGYPRNAEIPKYRQLHGRVQCYNPYHGWVPLVFHDTPTANQFSERECAQAVPELESLLCGDGVLHMPFSPEAERHLMKSMSVPLLPTLSVPAQALTGILNSVRNTLLSWALELEERGILGEGLSFTTQEVSAAAGASYNINNFFGSVAKASIQQDIAEAAQVTLCVDVDVAAATDFVATLLRELPGLGLSANQEAELRAETDTIQVQGNSPKPKSSIIRESLRSIRSIVEGAAAGGGGALLAKLAELLI